MLRKKDSFIIVRKSLKDAEGYQPYPCSEANQSQVLYDLESEAKKKLDTVNPYGGWFVVPVQIVMDEEKAKLYLLGT